MAFRTEGIGRVLLKRLRTPLSIPLGLRHAEGTHLKRSDWWRQKVLVPVGLRCSQSSVCALCRDCVQPSIHRFIHRFDIVSVGLSFHFSFHPPHHCKFCPSRYRFPPCQPSIPSQPNPSQNRWIMCLLSRKKCAE